METAKLAILGLKNGKTFITYLEHCNHKFSMGKGIWDDSPRFMGFESFATVCKKSIMTAVHATENRYINVREFMHLMGLPHDFEITDPGHTEFRNQTARQTVILAVSQNVPVCTGKKNLLELCRRLQIP